MISYTLLPYYCDTDRRQSTAREVSDAVDTVPPPVRTRDVLTLPVGRFSVGSGLTSEGPEYSVDSRCEHSGGGCYQSMVQHSLARRGVSIPIPSMLPSPYRWPSVPMSDRSDAGCAAEDEVGDPRLEQYVRRHSAGDGRGDVLLIGVAHDHPASVARVAHILDAVEPDALALELPSLAIPLFRQYAADEYVPPRLGGEMSTAIQRAGDVRIVGIDGPNAAYFRRLVQRVVAERISTDDFREVVGDVARGTGQALACRVGAVIARLTPVTPKVYTHISYDCASFDSPSTQARHERDHVAQRQAFLRVVELPRSTTLIDEVREETMATRLSDLRSTGDVVAVIGIEHLDELSTRLVDEAGPTSAVDGTVERD